MSARCATFFGVEFFVVGSGGGTRLTASLTTVIEVKLLSGSHGIANARLFTGGARLSKSQSDLL